MGYVEFKVTARFPGASRVEYLSLNIRRGISALEIKV